MHHVVGDRAAHLRQRHELVARKRWSRHLTRGRLLKLRLRLRRDHAPRRLLLLRTLRDEILDILS